jgi:15-cis-phytoene synthase
MELYTEVAYENSRHLTLRYSTSFGISSRFFDSSIQPHIYAIYGFVRIADEIVDTYAGHDAAELLDDLEQRAYTAIKSGYSTDLIVHAFALTARQFDITKELIAPFFDSMRMDLNPRSYTDADYMKYIHGSAEVVGLMCLKVFVKDNPSEYKKLQKGAAALGSAYQKVNFLRDMAADYKNLGRLYFPGMSFDAFGDNKKVQIISDIKKDFAAAYPALQQLPTGARKATLMSYQYYTALLNKLEKTPAHIIKEKRIRIPAVKKASLLVKTAASMRNTK